MSLPFSLTAGGTSSCISTSPGPGPATWPLPLSVYAPPSHSGTVPGARPPSNSAGRDNTTRFKRSGSFTPPTRSQRHNRLDGPIDEAGAVTPETARMIEANALTCAAVGTVNNRPSILADDNETGWSLLQQP